MSSSAVKSSMCPWSSFTTTFVTTFASSAIAFLSDATAGSMARPIKAKAHYTTPSDLPFGSKVAEPVTLTTPIRLKAVFTTTTHTQQESPLQYNPSEAV